MVRTYGWKCPARILFDAHLLVYNIKDALNIVLPQRIFARWTTFVWIGGRRLSPHLPVCNPFVNGARDDVLLGIRNFFFINHPLAVNLDEVVEVVVAETSMHVKQC